MDIGLYQLKYPVRRMLGGILPRFRDVDPNHLSWAMLPVGFAIALAYYVGARTDPVWYLLGALLIFLRMFLGTMDGLVAVTYDKATPAGEMLNRLAPELCDAMVMLALALAWPEWRVPAIGALVLCWLITFAGLLGATVGLPPQSVGPAGQTDRLATLQVVSVLAFVWARLGWGVDWIWLFLWWVVLGGAVTVVLRLYRHFGALADAGPPA